MSTSQLGSRTQPVITVEILRALFRNLQAFHAVYETDGVDTIIAPDGTEWCLWDLDYLYRQLPALSIRQSQAIELCLVQNIRESDVAKIMGVLVNSPVSMYSATGLARLIVMIEAGDFPRFRVTQDEDEQEAM